ncbi:MAG: ClpXP protease specificity-enhancing factor [Chromatiales bacterium]|jgi:stringent starvation protein B|nr:ClpXP protease specificity-enhancing factor [Chromatiales bacterium]
MTDNNETPLLVVDAAHSGVQAPGEYAEQGKLILNVSYSATSSLLIGNDAVTFSARFNGRPMNLIVPIDAVMAVYGRETGEGMVFSVAEDDVAVTDDSATADSVPQPSKTGRPQLKVVK